jgi:colanic acid/amylovoran biosynthesis glycosyltransferase
MTRLGYLVPEWPAQTHAFFWRELSALRALGDEVSLFSTRRPPEDACRHGFAAEARATTRYLYPPRARESARLLARHPGRTARAFEYLAKLKQTELKERAKLAALVACAADLVVHCDALGIEHVHAHSAANAAHLLVLAHLLGGPGYSLTLHGDLEIYGVDHPAKMQRARFVSAVTRPLQKQILDATSLTAEQVPVIWMGVDTDRFTPPPGHEGKAGRLDIVTVARLNVTKGHVYALEAVKQCRDAGIDVRYAIAGEGPYRELVEKKIAELNLGAHVQMLGSLGENQVLELLRKSDAFVLSSEGLGEAAPVSVMEAMAIGKPVVCSRIGGTGDMIHDGVDGLLIEQKDVPGFAAAFTSLARDPSLRVRLGEAARKQALEAFDYRIMARRLHDTIAASVGSRPAARAAVSR